MAASPLRASPCSLLSARGPYSYEHVKDAGQRRDPNSFLNLMERIIRMREEVPEIGWGDFEILQPVHPPYSRSVTTGKVTRSWSFTT